MTVETSVSKEEILKFKEEIFKFLDLLKKSGIPDEFHGISGAFYVSCIIAEYGTGYIQARKLLNEWHKSRNHEK